MDPVSAQSGPSTPRHRKRDKAKSRSAQRGDGPTVATPKASPSQAVEQMDLDQPAIQAGSSKLPATDVPEPSWSLKKKRRQERQRAIKLLPIEEREAIAKAKAQAAERASKKSSKSKKGKEKQRDESEWQCMPIAQGEASTIPPVWSNDRKFYFSASHNAVHIHSSTGPTYKRLSTISSTHLDGHRKKITGVLLHPINPLQLLTCGVDGQIKVWDWVGGRLLRTVAVTKEGQIHHMCLGQVGGTWYIFVTVAISKDVKTAQSTQKSHKASSDQRFRVLRVPLRPPKGDDKHSIRQLGKLSQSPSALFVSPRNSFLVALSGNKAYTYRLPTNIEDESWSATCVKFVSDQVFTCGAFAPEANPLLTSAESEEWFATGDVKGVIRLWHGLSYAFKQVDAVQRGQHETEDNAVERRLPTTSLHWHAHAVGALAFTPSGAQLLSVGEESVLVQWHLASGKREYIPRLGGRPLISLVVKEGTRGIDEEWWTGMADGSMIKVGAASGQVSTVGQGVRLDPLRPKSETAVYPLTSHPPTGSIVLPSSHPSTLQFIDPSTSTVQFDLEVSSSNRVSRRDEREHEPVAVEQVGFNQSTGKGQGDRWMATVEGRTGDEMEGGGSVRTLKFWRWTNDKYIVNTQYPRPHYLHEIVSISFSPYQPAPPGQSPWSSDPYLLTAARDGTAKLWHVRQIKRQSEGKGGKKPITEKFWSCRSTFSYRDMPIYAAAFSPDATIIAVAHGSCVTLWDVESNTLLKALEGGIEATRQLGFAGQDGRYLVTAGLDTGVAVWDLLSCEVAWQSASQPAYRLVTQTSSSIFVVSHEPENVPYWRTKFTVFTTASPTPIKTMTTRAKIYRLIPLPLSTPPDSSAAGLQFIGVTLFGEVYRFGANLHAASVTQNKIARKEEKGVSIWQEMFGRDAFVDLSTETMEDHTAAEEARDVSKLKTTKGGRPSEVFDGPSHTLPPPAILFDSFLEGFLGQPVTPDSRPQGTSGQVNGNENDGILYDNGPDADVEMEESMDTQSVAVPGRPVTDAEIKEVQSLFEGLLASSSTLPPPKNVQGSSKQLPNGDARTTSKSVTGPVTVANGHAESDMPKGSKETRKVSKRVVSKASHGGLVNGDHSGDGVDIGEKTNATGRKRKATQR